MPDGGPGPSLYLGLDSSTQSLSAVVIEVDGAARRVACEMSLAFDDTLPHYGTRHGVLAGSEPGVAVSSPAMWAEALDVMMGRLATRGLDMSRLAAISGSAQQHGSVYLNGTAGMRLRSLDPAAPMADQVTGMLSRPVAPIWLDTSTAAQCAEIGAAVGGQEVLARHTGSRAFERFTGPQIRKFSVRDPAGYAATDRIHLVSSFLASLLIGQHAPLDPGDASGMNLMDLATGGWWAPALEATAPELRSKLPAVVPAWTNVGRLSPYWQSRHGLPAARVAVWSGDNPSSLVGVGLVREGHLAVSLGTSDTVFGVMRAPRVDSGGTGHVFGSPTGGYMGLTCFSNGSLARERVRDAYGYSWHDFSKALDATPPGNGGRLLLPWFEPEITPPVARAGARSYGGLPPADGAANVRAVVEGQLMAMARHSRWMGVRVDRVHATGGGAANTQILQVMADVFGAEVRRFEVGNAAALGAALRAWHTDAGAQGRPLSWEEVVGSFVMPASAGPVTPDAGRCAIYRRLMPVQAACEAHALGHAGEPPLAPDGR